MQLRIQLFTGSKISEVLKSRMANGSSESSEDGGGMKNGSAVNFNETDARKLNSVSSITGLIYFFFFLDFSHKKETFFTTVTQIKPL